MGLFTDSQASACKIIKMTKVVRQVDSDTSETSWIVGVNDADGNYYDMQLTGLANNPNKSTIKSAVVAELIKREKQPAKVVEIVTEVEDKGLGETLG